MKSGAQLYLDYYKNQYTTGAVTEEQLARMVSSGTLTEEEKQYVMSDGEATETQLRELTAFHDAVMDKVRGT